MAMPKNKKKADKSLPEPIDWFQAMDRAFIAQDYVESNLEYLVAIEYTLALKKKMEKAVELLADIYLYAASKYFDTHYNNSNARIMKPQSNKSSKRIRRKP